MVRARRLRVTYPVTPRRYTVPPERFPAIGLGEDVRISGSIIVGGGLVVDDKVIHLVAFPGTTNKAGVPAGVEL